MNAATNPPLEEAAALDGPAAARLTGLSAKTLDRRALEGEPVGRIKIGRRVLFHRATLVAWMACKANPQTEPTPDNATHAPPFCQSRWPWGVYLWILAGGFG